MHSSYWTIWGSELSPFHLKIVSCLRYLQLPFHTQPKDGPWRDAFRAQLNVQAVKRKLTPLTRPHMSEDDEFPLVPYVFSPSGNSFYDSTAIALWFDEKISAPHQSLTRPNTALAHFLISLIDEYADEFGLYMVHHMRWTVSAEDNTAGERLGQEFRPLIGPAHRILANQFPRRQVKRLPYLFSVAPDGVSQTCTLPKRLQPPRHAAKGIGNFEATHAFLETAFDNLLSALDDALISEHHYLFGTQFSLADASIAGQLGMNLTDPSAAQHIQQRTPKVYGWLQRIYRGEFTRPSTVSAFEFDQRHASLLTEINRVFIPLMEQNKAAYQHHKNAGETLFNERAFWQGRALYHGVIDNTPFTHVAKSFQVKTWNTLLDKWHCLSDDERQQIHTVSPLKMPAHNKDSNV